MDNIKDKEVYWMVVLDQSTGEFKKTIVSIQLEDGDTEEIVDNKLEERYAPRYLIVQVGKGDIFPITYRFLSYFQI